MMQARSKKIREGSIYVKRLHQMNGQLLLLNYLDPLRALAHQSAGSTKKIYDSNKSFKNLSKVNQH